MPVIDLYKPFQQGGPDIYWDQVLTNTRGNPVAVETMAAFMESRFPDYFPAQINSP